MKKRKHVFCQKPLTHTIYEARRIAEIARRPEWPRRSRLATRPPKPRANSANGFGTAPSVPCARFRTGRAVPSGRKASSVPRKPSPCPKVWIGISGSDPLPSVLINHAYLPFVWRGWTDFGCGALGDMGSYSFDTIFRVLETRSALRAWKSSSSDRYDETYPLASIVRYNFPARGDMPPVKFTWYDGGLKPARPEELEENRPLKGRRQEEDEGLLFIGDRGKILCTFNGGNPKLIPQSKMDSLQAAAQDFAPLARQRTRMARRLQRRQNKARRQFRIRGARHRDLLLGNVASRMGQKLTWDHSTLSVNSEAAQKYVHPERRMAGDCSELATETRRRRCLKSREENS